jgi:hypothetical protein
MFRYVITAIAAPNNNRGDEAPMLRKISRKKAAP